jgi:hypothetical protein
VGEIHREAAWPVNEGVVATEDVDSTIVFYETDELIENDGAREVIACSFCSLEIDIEIDTFGSKY